jgi:holo-[acyl-carrier protein] synthase
MGAWPTAEQAELIPVRMLSGGGSRGAGATHRSVLPSDPRRVSASHGYPSGVEILGLGVDICEIERMERALGRHPAMRERVFTPEERAYCDAKARPAESYAGRFAAREAVIKALGGYRGRRWQDISVTRAPSGAPSIQLGGNAKARADALGISDVLISFTHEKTSAVAFAVAVSG